MKAKPTKSGILLAESSSGYTISFKINTSKIKTATEVEVSYDVVMNLMYPSCLATGCHILHQSQTVHGPGRPEVWSMWHLQGAQKRMSQRKGKCSDGHMGGACVLHHQSYTFRWDRAETGEGWRWILSCERHSISQTNHGLQQRYGWSWPVRSAHSALLHPQKHCSLQRIILLHFLDPATTDSFLLHREMSSAKLVHPMTHKDVMVSQLCGMDKTSQCSLEQESWSHSCARCPNLRSWAKSYHRQTER